MSVIIDRTNPPEGMCVMGFLDQYCQPNQVTRIHSQPQLQMLAEYLVVWNRCADFFIESIRIGNISAPQVNANPIPASPFIAELKDFQKIFELAAQEQPIKKEALAFFKWPTPPLKMGPVRWGMYCEIQVTHHLKHALPFAAMILGRSIDG